MVKKDGDQPAIFKAALSFLGIYYLITGLWGIISINSFIDIVWQKTFELHSIFLMHTLSLLFVILGLFFLLGARKNLTVIYGFAGEVALALFLVELYYLKHVRGSLLFYDLFVEGILGVLLLYSYVRR